MIFANVGVAASQEFGGEALDAPMAEADREFLNAAFGNDSNDANDGTAGGSPGPADDRVVGQDSDFGGGLPEWGPRRTKVPDNYMVTIGGQTDKVVIGGAEFSATSGVNLNEAASGLSYGSLRQTTACAIRAVGGSVTFAPELNRSQTYINNLHVNVTLPTTSPFGASSTGPRWPCSGGSRMPCTCIIR